MAKRLPKSILKYMRKRTVILNRAKRYKRKGKKYMRKKVTRKNISKMVDRGTFKTKTVHFKLEDISNIIGINASTGVP
jgi:hypothetical protein